MFSPTSAVIRGQLAEQGLSQAELEGRALRDQLATRKAAAAMGSSNYFTGFDGVEGATRPEYLKELYASGDPEAAMKMEAMLAVPFTTARTIDTVGKTEEAKKSADMKVYLNAMRSWMGDDPAGFKLAGGDGGESVPAGGGGIPVGEAPSIPGMAKPTSLAPIPNLSRLSGDERSLKMGPQGPEFSVKSLSPFEKQIKIGEDQVRRVTAGIAGAKEQRETIQAAHDNVRKVSDEIQSVQKAMQNRDVEWGEGQRQIQELSRNLQEFSKQRDALVSGGTPAESAPTSYPISSSVGAPISRSPTPGPTPQFTNKEQGTLDVQNRNEKITASNKEIVNARLGTEKVMKYKRQVQDLFDLVTKQDIGHPTLEGIPGAGNVLSLNRANAQVKKLNEAIINMFAEPGQSQMMNTIVERQMQGAVVPSIFTDPQLNKINAAVLRSNVEHLQNFPTFLEKWQKAHANTLDGAADAWVDYTDHNPLYTYSRNARGQVKVMENPHVLPIDKWQKLRATGGVRSIGDKTFMRMDDGSWVEK